MKRSTTVVRPMLQLTANLLCWLGFMCLPGVALATMTPEEITQSLTRHNDWRAAIANGDAVVAGETNNQPTASNMVKLVWDEDLAAVAQEHANGCDFSHSSSQARSATYEALTGTAPGWIGENIAAAFAGPGFPMAQLRARYQDHIDSWTAELADYTYGSPGNCTGVCGHYTQVVWANSVNLGCGIAECPTLTGLSGGPFTGAILVCNYLPGGNFNNQAPYQTGAAASSCPGDYPVNDNGLCAAGTPPGEEPTAVPLLPPALLAVFAGLIAALGAQRARRS